MKNERARVVKTLYSYIVDAQRRRKSNHLSLYGCRYEEDPFNNKGARVITADLSL